MRAWFFIWVFGALALQTLFLVPFWICYAHTRRTNLSSGQFLRDRFYLLSTAIASTALGILLIYSGRLYGNLAEGLSPILLRNEGYVIGLGLLCLYFGMKLMVVLADLEQHPAKWTWTKIGFALTLAWSIASFFVAQHVPLPINAYMDGTP